MLLHTRHASRERRRPNVWGHAACCARYWHCILAAYRRWTQNEMPVLLLGSVPAMPRGRDTIYTGRRDERTRSWLGFDSKTAECLSGQDPVGLALLCVRLCLRQQLRLLGFSFVVRFCISIYTTTPLVHRRIVGRLHKKQNRCTRVCFLTARGRAGESPVSPPGPSAGRVAGSERFGARRTRKTNTEHGRPPVANATPQSPSRRFPAGHRRDSPVSHSRPRRRPRCRWHRLP